MTYAPYARFTAEELILRDHLAMDRTILANERTFLAYIRTALAFAAAGVSLVHFFDSPATEVLGWALIPVAAITFVVGLVRYTRMRSTIHQVRPPYAT
ncbi:MAG: DUF202 domain-containing protein [Chloroflexi bacterium]|nr:DUF202 domain-containing protein [Chloroflexota bacterium]